MRINIRVIGLLFLVAIMGCNIGKKLGVKKGTSKDAIIIAIEDFCKTSTNTNYDVYFTHFKDIDDKTLGVSISKASNLLYPSSSNKIGTNIPYFPTQYFEKDDKLFYWYDSSHFVTIKLIEKLNKYKQIDSLNVDEFKGIPETNGRINESLIATHYFFCKNNLYKFKKKESKIALGYYKPPKMNCNSK